MKKVFYSFFVICLFLVSCSGEAIIPEPEIKKPKEEVQDPDGDEKEPEGEDKESAGNEEKSENEENAIDWAKFADDFQHTLQNSYKSLFGTYSTLPSNSKFNYWYNAHALDVLTDGYNRTKDPEYLDLMKKLLKGIKIRNFRYWQVYVDDMDWLGIACMNAWKATDDKEYKEVADYILGEIKKAHTEVCGGGLQWRFDQPNGKNACSTGPGAILALRMYAADKNEDDLKFAKELFEWEKTTLLNPSNNLIWDNIKLDNGKLVIQKWQFTYNVGTYIGMANDLYKMTGDKYYLDLASKSALASITSGDMVKNNMFKETVEPGATNGDGGLFKGILIRYLTELVYTEGLSDDTLKSRIVDFMKYNAILLYEKGTTPSPDVFASSKWDIRPEKPEFVSTQLSAMMLVEAMAKFDSSGLLKKH